MKPLNGLRVLVLDDDEDSRDLLAFVLSSRGASVTGVGDSSAALEALKRERPHVVLSDLSMPGEDGFQFLARLRALPAQEGGGTAALALSAHAGDGDRARSLASGFEDHVSKPVDPGQLVVLLGRFVPAPVA